MSHKDRSNPHLSLMGRRTRSHFSSSVYVPSRDKRLKDLKSDFASFGLAWPFDELEKINAAQGSTLSTNARSSNALGDFAKDGEAPGDPLLHAASFAA